MMEMLQNFDLVSALVGLIPGVMIGFFTGRSGKVDLAQSLNTARAQFLDIYEMLIRERDLTAGLTQELAAQAKIVK